MEDNLFWVDKAVPVFNVPFLPAIWTVAITIDVAVKEVSITDDPDLVFNGKMG